MKVQQSSITSLLMLGVLSATLAYTIIFCTVVYYSQADTGGAFFQRVSLFGIPFLFILMLVIALTIKLIMTPLTKAMRQAEEISFVKPDIRLDAGVMPMEIQPFAHAVNEALDRLELGITAQRDFIANAAHELRTPLSILRTHVDLIEDKDAAASLREDVETMARLVAQLLDTARLESPEKLEMHDVDLSTVIREVSQSVWPLALKEGRKLEVEGIDEPCIVTGNHDALSRALRNLFENALHHTPKGTPISMILEHRSIKVRDHGKGVPEGDKEKIFQKFARRDMQKGGGAGLGLFIVRRIMTMHGGNVTVSTAPGGGSIFSLNFPPV